jgi:hypothetical protein
LRRRYGPVPTTTLAARGSLEQPDDAKPCRQEKHALPLLCLDLADHEIGLRPPPGCGFRPWRSNSSSAAECADGFSIPGNIYKSTSGRLADSSVQQRLLALAADIGKHWPELPVAGKRAVFPRANGNGLFHDSTGDTRAAAAERGGNIRVIIPAGMNHYRVALHFGDGEMGRCHPVKGAAHLTRTVVVAFGNRVRLLRTYLVSEVIGNAG